METVKFNVGDTVFYKSPMNHAKDDTGVVLEVNPFYYSYEQRTGYKVKWQSGVEDWITGDNLSLVKKEEVKPVKPVEFKTGDHVYFTSDLNSKYNKSGVVTSCTDKHVYCKWDSEFTKNNDVQGFDLIRKFSLIEQKKPVLTEPEVTVTVTELANKAKQDIENILQEFEQKTGLSVYMTYNSEIGSEDKYFSISAKIK